MFRVITMDNCRYCRLAKSALDARDLAYTEEVAGPELRAQLVAVGLTTLPQIYYSEEPGIVEHIGGFDDLTRYLNERDDA